MFSQKSTRNRVFFFFRYLDSLCYGWYNHVKTAFDKCHPAGFPTFWIVNPFTLTVGDPYHNPTMNGNSLGIQPTKKEGNIQIYLHFMPSFAITNLVFQFSRVRIDLSHGDKPPEHHESFWGICPHGVQYGVVDSVTNPPKYGFHKHFECLLKYQPEFSHPEMVIYKPPISQWVPTLMETQMYGFEGKIP